MVLESKTLLKILNILGELYLKCPKIYTWLTLDGNLVQGLTFKSPANKLEILPMDPNQNNNTGQDPNTTFPPAGAQPDPAAPSLNPAPPAIDNPSPLSQPGPAFNPTDLNMPTPPPAADPQPAPNGQNGNGLGDLAGMSAWGSTPPSTPTDTNTTNTTNTTVPTPAFPAPAPDATDIPNSSLNPDIPSAASPAGVPDWAAPSPVSDIPSGNGQPTPTYTPSPVPAADISAPADSNPSATSGGWSGGFTADPSLGTTPAAAPDVNQTPFPQTWPPAPSTTASFDMSPMPDSGTGEAGPTDLSHLMNGSTPAEITTPAPQTLAPDSTQPVVPDGQNSKPGDVNQGGSQVVTTPPSGGFPKWAILVGGVVLILVLAASAYFILGVGSTPEQTTSLPAEQAPLTNPPRTILPAQATPTPMAATPSAGTSSFGALQGGSQPATSSGQSGSSALELLRQRQGR